MVRAPFYWDWFQPPEPEEYLDGGNFSFKNCIFYSYSLAKTYPSFQNKTQTLQLSFIVIEAFC